MGMQPGGTSQGSCGGTQAGEAGLWGRVPCRSRWGKVRPAWGAGGGERPLRGGGGESVGLGDMEGEVGFGRTGWGEAGLGSRWGRGSGLGGTGFLQVGKMRLGGFPRWGKV